MEPYGNDDYNEECGGSPKYLAPGEIESFGLSDALSALYLLGGDPGLTMQVFNLAIVDQFIMQLEYETLRKLHDEESTPTFDAAFLSAQSQMWIFAAYEILRTWRQRANDALKLYKTGGLKSKIDDLERKLNYVHAGRQLRANQLRKLLDDPTIVATISEDLRMTHIPFARVAHIRIAIAKHEVRGRKKSIAYAPGYGRINRWCGSLDYELEIDGAIMGNISRRDIADELRSISDRNNPPTDEAIASFDEFMKGSPADLFSVEG